MENQQTEQEGLFERIKEYVQVRIRLAVLVSTEKAAEVYASLVSNLLMAIFLVMAFLFGSLALAFYLAERFKSTWCGFLCVAGIYLLIALFYLLLKKKMVEKPLMDQAVRKFLAEKGELDE
jgi:polyferredoxin